MMSVRRIRISGELLNTFSRSNELWTSTLPDDVNVVAIAGEDQEPQAFVLLVESQEFSPVAEGQLIPYVEPTFRRLEAHTAERLK